MTTMSASHTNETTCHKNQRERIAIVGSGISGLTCAYLLSSKHDVTLYEAQDSLGGHTNTERVEIKNQVYPVNTGFIVFNDRTYPNFIKLMETLAVPSEDSSMSFSVQAEDIGLEYNGTNLNALFSQRKNIISPRFWQMIQDILRFNRLALDELTHEPIDPSISLGDYLKKHKFNRYFTQYYIIPMAAAIWSCPEKVIYDFPLAFFLKFLSNHGLLQIKDRPQWKVLQGGSETYIKAIIDQYQGTIHLETPVKSINRTPEKVVIESKLGTEEFDHVILSCHSDQALSCLAQPTDLEKDILGAIDYQDNDVVLHTDTNLLPKSRRAWASWNYFIPHSSPKAPENSAVTVTYNMNILQNFLSAPETFCVTLNRREDINPNKIIKTFNYAHPVYSSESVAAQLRYEELAASPRTHFCGAYWFNGFHEDGVRSALRVTQKWGLSLT